MPRDLQPSDSSPTEPPHLVASPEAQTPATTSAPPGDLSAPTPALEKTAEDAELAELTRSGSDFLRHAPETPSEDGTQDPFAGAFTIHASGGGIGVGHNEDDDDDDGSMMASGPGAKAFQLLRGRSDSKGIGRDSATGWGSLHPYVQTLSLRDLDSCEVLEQAVFSEGEAADRNTVAYRLTVCPELCLGIFSSMSPQRHPKTQEGDLDPTSLPTYKSAHPADSSVPERKAVLIAMITATKTTDSVASDDAIGVPPDWRTALRSSDSNKKQRGANTEPEIDVKGHQEGGRTIALWTLGVLPQLQGRGLGKVLMRSYQQRMSTSGIADRISLIAHERLLSMYEGFGYENRGKSDAKYGGGGWWDLVYEFSDIPGPPPFG